MRLAVIVSKPGGNNRVEIYLNFLGFSFFFQWMHTTWYYIKKPLLLKLQTNCNLNAFFTLPGIICRITYLHGWKIIPSSDKNDFQKAHPHHFRNQFFSWFLLAVSHVRHEWAILLAPSQFYFLIRRLMRIKSTEKAWEHTWLSELPATFSFSPVFR